jgi:hypothetical protein
MRAFPSRFNSFRREKPSHFGRTALRCTIHSARGQARAGADLCRAAGAWRKTEIRNEHTFPSNILSSEMAKHDRV